MEFKRRSGTVNRPSWWVVALIGLGVALLTLTIVAERRASVLSAYFFGYDTARIAPVLVYLSGWHEQAAPLYAARWRLAHSTEGMAGVWRALLAGDGRQALEMLKPHEQSQANPSLGFDREVPIAKARALLILRKPADALATLDAAFGPRPRADYEALITQAMAQLQLRQTAEAERYLLEALSDLPDHGWMQTAHQLMMLRPAIREAASPVLLALYHAHLAPFDPAQGRRAIALADKLPEHAGAAWIAARMYLHLGEDEQALERYEAALRDPALKPRALVAMSEIHSDRGDLVAAREVLEQARTAAPGDFRVMTHLLALLQEKLGDYPAVLREGNAFLAMRPSATALRHMSEAQWMLGDVDAALALAQKGVEVDPRWADMPALVAHYHEELFQYEQAAHYYRVALQRRPYWPEAHIRLASAFESMGRYQEAVTEFERVFSYAYPENWASYARYCTALQLVGRQQDALKCIDFARQRAPGDAYVAEIHRILMSSRGGQK